MQDILFDKETDKQKKGTHRPYTNPQLFREPAGGTKKLPVNGWGNHYMYLTIKGLEAGDTCSTAQVALEDAMVYLGDRRPTKQVSTEICDNAAFKPVIVGRLENEEGLAVASFLTDARVPVISYAATIADLTKDSDYSFFSRIIPSDTDISMALVGILKEMGWTYIAMVTTDNEEERAAGATFKDVAESNGICLSVSQTVEDGTTEMGTFDTVVSNIVSKSAGIKVVVLFTSSSLAQGLYAAAERSTADFQWVVGHRALLDQTSQAQQPRGLVGVVPQNFQDQDSMADFESYFRGLTPESVNTTADPWFLEYYQKSLGCNIGSPSGTIPQCGQSHAIQHMNNYVRNRYITSVYKAVDIAALAVRTLRNSKCASTLGVCTALQGSTAEEWRDVLRSVRSSLGGNDEGFTSVGSTLNTELKILNMKRDGAGGYALQETGSWVDGALTFDPLSLDLWTGDLMQPVTSFCTAPCTDPACLGVTDNRTMVYIPGDLIIGGLFSLHTWDATNEMCGAIRLEGILRLEAMLYELDQINGDSEILAGITLGMDGFDTCSSERQAGVAAQHFISNAEFGSSGSGERITSDGTTEVVYGIIGPESDDEIITVSRVLHLYDVPLIGYDSSNPLLSSHTYFPNIARVTPVNYAETIPLARALAQKGFRYVQVIYTEEFRTARSVFASEGRRNNLCVAQELQVHSATDWAEIIQKFSARSEAKVVAILTDADTAKAFVSYLVQQNLIGRYYLVGNSQFPVDFYLQTNQDVVKGLTVIGRQDRHNLGGLQQYLLGLRPETNIRNPWFAEFWMDHFQCSLPGYQSIYSTVCTGTESLTETDVYDAVSADVVDATYLMGLALKSLQTTYCSSGQVCPEMTGLDGTALYADILKQIALSPLNDGELIRFNSIGDPISNFYVSNYQLNGGELQKIQIASYLSYSFTTTDASVKVYDESGQEVTGITVECTGLCDECTIINKGLTATIEGDIMIGGFFGLTDPAADQVSCSERINEYNIQLVEAFLYAIDEVNNDDTLLPNMNLGGVAFDTCGIADIARRETSNYVGGTVEYRSGYFTSSVSVAGVIGGQTSDTSLAIADVLNNFLVNQISYGASTTELTDSEKFPYFLRTLPSDTQQARAMMDLVSIFDWTYVSIVYSDNAYGNDMYAVFAEQAHDANICLAMAVMVPATGEVDYFEIVDQLLANPQSHVVVLLTSALHTKGVLEAAQTMGAVDLQWIGGDTWGSREYVTDNAPTAARGALIVELQDDAVTEFRDYFTTLMAYNNFRNPWWQEYVMDALQCQISGKPPRYDDPCPFSSLDLNFTQSAEVGYIINAVRAFATGLDAAIKSLCPNLALYHTCEDIYSNPEILHEHIKSASFTGVNGEAFMFDDYGDGPPRYNIINLVNDNLVYKKVGTWESGDLNIETSEVRFFNGVNEVSLLESQCAGRCAECSQAAAPQPVAIQRNGELQIVGLFAAHDGSSDISAECGALSPAGVVSAEAMLYAIQQINTDSALLTGVTLGTATFDTCQSTGRGVSELSGFLSGARYGDHQPWYQIAGVVAGGSQELVSVTAAVAEKYKYTQATYSSSSVTAATPSSLLSVAPSTTHKATALLSLLANYQWTYIGAAYDSSDQQQVDLFNAFKEMASQQSTCIGAAVQFTSTNLAATLQTFHSDADLNVVVVFANSALSKLLIEASSSLADRRLTFILAFPQEYLTSDITTSFEGVLALFTQPAPADFQDYFTSLVPTEESSPWFLNYIEEKFDCEVDNDGNHGNPCSGTVRAPSSDVIAYGSAVVDVINSVYAIARGTHALLQELCGNSYNGLCDEFVQASGSPQELQSAIAGVTFTGSGGKAVSFANGAKVPQFDVWNGQQTGNSASFVKVGSWEVNGLSLNQADIQLLDSASITGYVQSQCTPGTYCEEVCSAQATGALPPTNSPTDRANAIPFSDISTTRFYILITLAVIGALFTIVIIIMVIARWSTPSTQKISPFLHLTLLLGILLLYLLVPIFSAPVSASICGLQQAGSGLAYAICYISVFLLVTRLYRVGIRERRITGKRAPLINNSSQAVLFSIFFLIEVVFLVQLLVQQPPTDFVYIVSNTGSALPTTRMYCGYSGLDAALALMYVYLLMLMALFVSVHAWCSVKVVFAREFSIFILTMLLCVAVMLAWIVAVVVVDRAYMELASSTSAIIQASLLLFILVVPKVKLICCGQHNEFWESASVTSSEYGGHPRPSDFDGVENYGADDAIPNEYSEPSTVVAHDNPAYENVKSDPDLSMGISSL